MKRLLLSLNLLILSLVFIMPVAVSAAASFDPLAAADCNKALNRTSAVCQDKTSKDPLSGDDGLLVKITNIVAFVGGAAAVIMILIGALRYITSGSDLSTNSRTDTDVESAKHTLNNAVIGLVVIVLARSLILFVLDKIK